MKRPGFPLALAALALAVAAGLSCSPGYVIRAGIEEGRILSRRRALEEVAADPRTPERERLKLRLVKEARDFAEHVLGLEAGKSYTTYSRVDRDTLLLVVTAAHRDRFAARTWWFPIVGHVPYKGFFDFDAAFREASNLEAQGFDASVRPSAAFSTLGWFNDPVLSTVLRSGDVAIAATVIHEILHNTLFLPSQVSFNESFAAFVGDRGAVAFFCSRDGEDGALCREARDEWADNLVFGAYLSGLIAELETLYGRGDLSRERKVAMREDVFDQSRRRFRAEVLPALRTRSHRGFADRALNNATLIGIRLYYRGLDRFEAAFQKHGGDLVATIRAIETATRERPGDPYAALEAVISGVEAEAGAGAGVDRP
jgi:predicted aminopeptidase